MGWSGWFRRVVGLIGWFGWFGGWVVVVQGVLGLGWGWLVRYWSGRSGVSRVGEVPGGSGGLFGRWWPRRLLI